MDFTYDNILKFMTDYFAAFPRYAQDHRTSHRMHDYFLPEFEFIAYIAGYAPISGREQFLRRMAAHPSSREMLTPEDIMIDEKRKVAVALIKADVSDTATGKLLVTKRYQALYQLVRDMDETIKIRKVLFFEEVLPRGVLDLNQVFGRDWGTANTSADKRK